MPTWLAITIGVLSFAVAFYGAILSTVVYRRQQERDKPKLRVECGLSYRRDPERAEKPALCFTVQARNFGFRPIEVEGAGFLVDSRSVEVSAFEVEPDPCLPVCLEDGESVRFHYRYDRDVAPHKKLSADRVYVRAAGERYETEPPPGLRPVTVERDWPPN